MVTLDLPEIPVTIYIDLYLLYKYSVKLDRIKAKFLIIDIIILKELYIYKSLFKYNKSMNQTV